MSDFSNPKGIHQVPDPTPELPHRTWSQDLDQDQQVREDAVHVAGQTEDLLDMVCDEESQWEWDYPDDAEDRKGDYSGEDKIIDKMEAASL